jgi:hypothetical protein
VVVVVLLELVGSGVVVVLVDVLVLVVLVGVVLEGSLVVVGVLV